MNNDILKTFFDKDDLDKMVNALSQKINEDYKGKTVVFVGLLSGCQPFLSDLLKKIDLYCLVDYMQVSSYDGGTTSSGVVTIKKDVCIDLENHDVLIVDDICDTGITLKNVIEHIKGKKAKSVEVVCLLNKIEGRTTNVNVKYYGGEAPNEFVVGYGLDYKGLYRNLNYIGVLKEEVYKK